ncbi:hypothetical protein IFM89_030907 [Coptis chinensis]|uniref:Uncharacterized protein n=1 Tax=Coptis chinensis TaxID=261450 RepID=A0A835M024_9MAGN|nr:hypothetical protein IFM89_030907 [Coptis chinensis]
MIAGVGWKILQGVTHTDDNLRVRNFKLASRYLSGKQGTKPFMMGELQVMSRSILSQIKLAIHSAYNSSEGHMSNSCQDLATLHVLGLQSRPRKAPKIHECYWLPTPPSILKANIDGSSRGNPRLAGARPLGNRHDTKWIGEKRISQPLHLHGEKRISQPTLVQGKELHYPKRSYSVVVVVVSACKENCLVGGSCVASTSLTDGTGQRYLKVSSFLSGCQSPALPSKSFIKVCSHPGLPNPPPSTVNSNLRCSRKLSAWGSCSCGVDNTSSWVRYFCKKDFGYGVLGTILELGWTKLWVQTDSTAVATTF